ncbi:unnamed protein product, partial [Nesidiocoris tenuis]
MLRFLLFYPNDWGQESCDDRSTIEARALSTVRPSEGLACKIPSEEGRRVESARTPIRTLKRKSSELSCLQI